MFLLNRLVILLVTIVRVRLPHPRSGDSRGQGTFLALSADKQTCNYDIECSNHHPSLSTLRPKGMSRSKKKWWPIYTNLPVDVRVTLTHPMSGDSQGQETFSEPSADKQTRNYDTECSNYHPSLSTLRPKELTRRKMKWRAIYTNLPVDVIVRLPHPWSGYSRGQETFTAPSADKQARNYDIECSNHHIHLSTVRSKGFSHSKMKWWAIYRNLPVDVTVKLPHPRSWDSQGQEKFLAPSANKQIRDYDIESSNTHPSLSTPRPKGLSRSKMKWWAIYRNFPVDVMVRIPHPWSGYRWGQETFLAPSPDKQTRNYDIECSNHHPSLSTLRPKGFNHSKMKWWAIYRNLPVDVILRLTHYMSADSQGQETFLSPSANK